MSERGVPRTLRRLLLALLGVLLVATLASVVLWYWATARIAQGVADWTRAVAAQGWTVQSGAASRGGWPFAATVAFDAVAIAGGAPGLPVGYAAERVSVGLDFRNPAVLQVQGFGQQSLRLGSAPPLPFTAERLSIGIALTPGAPATQAELNAAGIRVGGVADGLSIALLEAQADWAAWPGLSLRLSAEAITLPPPPAPQAALGPHIASATFEGTFGGTIPATAPSFAAAASGWRDSGGAIVLRRIAVGWGPLGVSGSATLKLDATLQPDVTATLRLVGMEETLTALAGAKLIAPRAAQTAKAVAALMAHAPEGGGAPGVEVPLTLHGGTLALGMIPLATLPKLIWPDAP